MIMPAAKKNTPASGEKLDLFRLHKADYVAKKKPVLVTPAGARYLLVEGRGAPGSELFQNRVGAIYGMAYTIKMTRKFNGLGDYTICKLEARFPELAVEGSRPPMDEWDWELFIRTPDFITPTDLKEALAALAKRDKEGDSALVRLVPIKEGECVQMLHLGPYEEEGRTLDAMHAFAESEGRVFIGPHHEIYLSDPRRIAPEKLKTILRMPVQR